MKRIVSLVVLIAMLVSCLVGCGASSAAKPKTQSFVDSAGRTVELPAELTSVAPSGGVAQMVLITLAPESLAGLSSIPEDEQMTYLPAGLKGLSEFGQFYGSKANLNMEALVAAAPQLIIDMGNKKDNIAEDMDALQQQTGIPTIFIDTSLEQLPAAYRTLGKLLGKQTEAETLAAYIEKTLKLCEDNRAQLLADERRTVVYGTGPDGLACNAAGSMQADAIELVGGINVVEAPEGTQSNRNGGCEISMEQLYLLDPEVLLLDAAGAYDTVTTDASWQPLQAVQSGNYYEVPSQPYSWLSSPPSVNRVLGLYWLGHLLYPELYDYNMAEKVQEFYRLFWHYELSQTEAAAMLDRAQATDGN